MDQTFDISSINDKITWEATSTLALLVRKPDGNHALALHCTPIGHHRWMLTKTVIGSSGFDAVKGALGNQELVNVFDDLQEALGAGTAVAHKWLADPDAVSITADRDR